LYTLLANADIIGENFINTKLILAIKNITNKELTNSVNLLVLFKLLVQNKILEVGEKQFRNVFVCLLLLIFCLLIF